MNDVKQTIALATVGIYSSVVGVVGPSFFTDVLPRAIAAWGGVIVVYMTIKRLRRLNKRDDKRRSDERGDED